MPNITTNHAITYTSRLNIFPEILKKISKYPKKISLNISTNPRNIAYFCLENKPILNLLGQNFPQRGLKSMFRLMYVSSIRHFDKWLLVSSDMEYIIQVENR